MKTSLQSGSVLVEAAFVTPLLMMMFMGIVQFGQMYGVLSNLRGASAVAARAAILGAGRSATEVCDTARAAVGNLVDVGRLECRTSPSYLPAKANTPVTITLNYPMPVLSGASAFLPGPTLTLTAKTTMQ
jgi:Flp pilus assembly protein TadG